MGLNQLNTVVPITRFRNSLKNADATAKFRYSASSAIKYRNIFSLFRLDRTNDTCRSAFVTTATNKQEPNMSAPIVKSFTFVPQP